MGFERSVYYRERAAAMYSSMPYSAAQAIVEVRANMCAMTYDRQHTASWKCSFMLAKVLRLCSTNWSPMVAQVPYILVQGVLFTCISYYLIGALMLSGHAARRLACRLCKHVAFTPLN